jgi:probable rRNA maturation factor
MKIWVDLRSKKRGVRRDEARRKASRVLKELGLKNVELSLLLVDDYEMERLNSQFLGRQAPTNVIAFSQLEGEGPPGSPLLLGDVVISLDTCQREAQEAGISFCERFLELLVHGTLHLLGYEHEGDEQRAALMSREEKRILEALACSSK